MTLSSQQVYSLLKNASDGATVYLIGAAGCGMSGLGHLLLDLKFRVEGSDLAINEEVRQLEARGAVIHIGHDRAQLLNSGAFLVVYSPAVPHENAELQAALEKGIPTVRRAVLLAALANHSRAICVAGMHGKTTTAALLAFALKNLNANPSYAIGGLVPQLRRHARFAPDGGVVAGLSHLDSLPDENTAEFKRSGSLFVVETDESDGTLREFHPEFSIVLNIDEEHMDYFGSMEAVCAEFHRFALQTRGRLFFCADDARLVHLLSRQPEAISFGFHPRAKYRVLPVPDGFEVWRSGKKLGNFSVQIAGEKNVSNAAAVIAILSELGFGAAEIAKAIRDFAGAARRQQELFHDGCFRVIDDYGHHPAEITATISAVRQRGAQRVLVAFQPHRYTRTRALLSQFASCFRGADKLWVSEIYPASETPIVGVNGSLLAEAIRETGQAVEWTPSIHDLPDLLLAATRPGDLVLFLGAGDITKAAHTLAMRLAQQNAVLKETVTTELGKQLSPEARLRLDEALAKRTTLRVGGTADIFVEPASESDLAAVIRFATSRQLPLTILGRGSNLLIRDGGIRGVVVCLNQKIFSEIDVVDEYLTCGAGVKLKTVSVEARRHGLAGLEFLEGIPGSIGGALRMNAGAMGYWIFEHVHSVRFMDYSGDIHERRGGDICAEYRGCPLFKDHVALSAVLKGTLASQSVIAERMKSFSQKRWDSQPAAPSAGCIFKNPQALPAGRLIDELGLKGTRVGGAVVSDLHGNFIVNDGGATARDVLNLIEIIKDRAKSTRGIELETEVQILGED